ncbi:molybdate ABC transporter substrate-binding protein [Luteolibacter flavescens]|uniref:Molybdate ABC transporter substrate-binding protein n=1 Tax=Luteolibacter flavescens TaxID=1859460 RepID=A0ABT3FUD4_9BACT|nr:molybdate ABC transporter substrate-binding protein [Luteolibacter flavescens]MCW1887162.1 molybdate ABC transporter substrate-binding protein [Luteolibacter flavescens]
MKALLLLLLASLAATAAELRVAAAASLAETVTEIAAAYEKAHGTKVTPAFAGSNVLARQIEAGAPLDVFISADEATMKKVEEAKLVRDVTKLLTNSLVIVVPAESATTVTSGKDLANFKRIAIGDPAAVPAGVYAKTWLTGQKLWDSIGPKCIGSENVRAALAAVESGNADAAIVYKTDAAISKKVKIAWTVPASESPAVIYPVAVCTGTKQADEAGKFAGFLKSEEASKIFAARGFGLAED